MTRVLEIWLSGGWLMIPLFGLAVLLYANAFQLMRYVRRINLDATTEHLWWDWVRKPEMAEGQVAEVIEYTQSDVSSAKQIRNRFDEVRLSLLDLVDRRTKFISTLVAAAPLLGLLGTVMGMLQTFFGIATKGGSEIAGAVAAGISAALVTTQTGLTLALPGLFFVMVARRQRHHLEARLARLESLTLNHLRVE